MKYFFALAVFVVLSGCAIFGKDFEGVYSSKYGNATLYFYFPNECGTVYPDSVTLFANDIRLFKFRNTGYARVEFVPGTYQLTQEKNSLFATPVSDKYTFEADKTYFFKFTSKRETNISLPMLLGVAIGSTMAGGGLDPVVTAGMGSQAITKTNLEQVNAEEALPQLQDTRLILESEGLVVTGAE